MMAAQWAALTAIRRSRVLAVLRAPDATVFPAATTVLAEAGIDCVEITLTSPGALHALAAMARAAERDGTTIGAGTVLTRDQAAAAVDAGATFLISPSVAIDVIEVGRERGITVITGAATPTEIEAAWQLGAHMVKVFPAAQLGGPAYISAIRGPFPDIPLVPTGGIRIDVAAEYLAAGAVAIGVGGPLTGELSGEGDLKALGQRARHLRKVVDSA